MTAPRESLAALLAIPYWVVAAVLGGQVAGVAVLALGLHGWVGLGVALATGVILGVPVAAAEDRLLGRLADYVWGHVEVVAQGVKR